MLLAQFLLFCLMISQISTVGVEHFLSYTDMPEDSQADIQKCLTGNGYVRLGEDQRDHNHTLLEMKTPRLLKNFANPCWIECYPNDRSTVYPGKNHYWQLTSLYPQLEKLADEVLRSNLKWRLRCMPKFYLIGMPKCGTTDLFHRLTLHPDVTIMGAKEIKWWSNTPLSSNDIYDFERYLDIADIAVSQIINDKRVNYLTNTTYYPMIFGDATPSTMFNNIQWERYPSNLGSDEPIFMTPLFMNHVQPDVKLIVILRDPVDMTFSSYKFFQNNNSNISVNMFHHCVVQSLKAFLECEVYHSMNWCSYLKMKDFNFTASHTECSFVLRSLQIGRYYIYLREWLKSFPREQFYIVKAEEYNLDRQQTLEDIWTFLGLSKLSNDMAMYISQMEELNVSKVSIGNMLPESRKLLQQFFQPANMKLTGLLNHKKYLWL